MSKIHENLKPHWKAFRGHLKDHFIPHEGNNHHPHVLKHGVLFGYTVILILLKIIAIVGPVALPSVSLYSSAITPQNIIELTNQTRKNLDLPILETSGVLAEAAKSKAEDMLANQYFAHTSPSGVTPWEWFRKMGYAYRYAGENLAVHFHEAEEVNEGWLASPTHRANIVSDRYSEIGVGVATGIFEGVNATFVVQMFGEPIASATTASVAVATIPAPEVTPEAPAPAAEEITPPANTPQKIVAPPVIKEETLAVKPTSDTTYDVKVELPNTTQATVVLATEQTELTKVGESDTWRATVDYDSAELNQSGEPLVVTAVNKESMPVTKAIALLAPKAKTQEVYNFRESTDRFTEFLGFFRVGNLDDKVRQFYLGFIVLLGAGLLLNTFYFKLRAHHPSVVGHTVAVIALAAILLVI